MGNKFENFLEKINLTSFVVEVTSLTVGLLCVEVVAAIRSTDEVRGQAISKLHQPFTHGNQSLINW